MRCETKGKLGSFGLTSKMASLYCNNHVRDSCFSSAHYGKSCSKAQACLEKILHIISTIPPPCQDNPNSFKKRGFEIDLNLRLASFVDGDESEEKSESLAENSLFGKNPDGEEEETDEIQEKTATATATATATDASSDVTEIQNCDEFKSGTDGEVKTAAAFNRSLDLLIEAAEMISDRDYCLNEKDKDVEAVENGRGSMKWNKESSVNIVEEAVEEFEDISPVVRSKRGRSQVLPLRFRDSVLEPWKKRPQRSAAAAAVVSKKKGKSG